MSDSNVQEQAGCGNEAGKHEASCGACSSGDNVNAARHTRRTFQVQGLDCAEEVAALRREVGPLVGEPEALSFDLIAGEMSVAAPADAVADDAVLGAVRRAGLRARPVGHEVETHTWWERRGRLVSTTASGAAIAAGIALHAALSGDVLAALGLAASGATPWPAAVLYLIATVAGARFVLPRAWASARTLRPDMNLLMTIAIGGAIGLGGFLEAASVSFLFALALLLESWSVARARRAVRALLAVAPPTARVLDPATRVESERAPEQVAIGSIVVVRPGERVPLDGVVVAGAASMDTSPVTGESSPSEAERGSEVFAGTIAIDGAIEVEVTRPASDTVLARIVARVAEAGRRRARAERWVDRFSRVYTPVVFATALLVATLPPVLAVGAWHDWFYRALVLLVIGCPCALVISTPVSVVAGLATAARHGVLVKGADVLELPARLAALAFDKTGTLTTGRPRVARVAPLDRHGEAEVLAIAAALERRSSHPIAEAIVAAVDAAGVLPPSATDVRAVAGRGVEGVVNGRPTWLGSHRLLEERGQETPALHALAEEMAQGGRTVVVVGEDHHVCGLIALEDGQRPEAARMVSELRQLGIRRIAMLTGDNVETADELARKVGITEVHAGLLPEDKLAVVDSLRAGGGRTPDPG